jgi:hypothetical protein
MIHKHFCHPSVNHKEIAKRLASCGLTPDTLGAVILELIRTPAMLDRQQNPRPESPWQIGFGDALRFLELEAGKVSAELAQLDSEDLPEDDDDRDHPSLTAAERNPNLQ